MKQFTNLKLILFFIGLTVMLTIIVVYAWEKILMSPLYTSIGATLPADEAQRQHWRFAQRIEHFFISIIVDAIVVSLLLWVVSREQRKLRASDERYRALFEQASDGIGIVAAADHRLVDANAKFAEILGYEPRQVIGMHVCELFHGNGGGSIAEWPLPLSRCSGAAGAPPDTPAPSGAGELAVETASGKRLPVSATYSTLATGKEKLFILNIHDLSAQKQLEKEKEEVRARLAQNERINTLGRMAAQVAHEVKNPLAGLRLYALHLKSKVDGKVDVKEMSLLDKIIGGIHHLSDTVDKVLNFARPLTLTLTRVNLNEIVTEAVHLLEAQMAASKIELQRDLTEPPPVAMLDKAAICAALINLMVNAIQAMADGGSLRIATRGNQNNVYLTIADTGTGMTPEQVEHIFEPFYTTKSQGLGLGMSYVWKVIQQHRGAISIESLAGKGTEIRISLPVEE
ncbi:MAG TPA: ATP-binding protein [Blastocatellia bacterium]|nr:ATP-binding protein [Blastocatellia bacterium]